MLADNIKFLKKNYPALYEALKKDEKKTNFNLTILEETKNNKKTLKVLNGEKSLYLHSRYDPIREAESIIDKLAEREDVDENSHVVFYGLGLGYHIDAFIKRFPKTPFSLYEPSAEVFNHFLEYNNLEKLPIKNIFTIQCETNIAVLGEFLAKLISIVDRQIIILDLPSYQNVFKEQYTLFLKKFKELIKDKKSSLNTDLTFQKRWIFNSVINLKEVINTPNILMQDKKIFKDKTAILVAAGPSLDYEIENLRFIKEKGLAYIFSVGSSINTLLYHNILPDAICTYDPTEENNLLVFKKINEMETNSIPLIYGSSVGFEVLQFYKGPKYHMITTQDTIAAYFLKNKNNNDEILCVKDAQSIAVVTIELLNILKFSTIILVGQNLALKDEKNYAEGIEYDQYEGFKIKENVIKIKDVLDNDILTVESFDNMRRQIEFYIHSFKINVINTTIGGAHIEGARFIPLKKVISDLLKSRIVEGNEFDNMLQTDLYDKEHLSSKISLMEEEYNKYKSLLLEIRQQIPKVKELIEKYNSKQTEVMYKNLNGNIEKLEANDFFKVIVRPMNRVQYEVLVNSAKGVITERNELVKTKKLINYIEPFIDLLYVNNNLNQIIMGILSENIKNSCKY